LLAQILDTEKKQLQGVYNLPEGANIMVPLEAALLAGKGTGTSELIHPDVSSQPSAITEAITRATDTNFNPDEYIGDLFDKTLEPNKMSTRELWNKGEAQSWGGNSRELFNKGEAASAETIGFMSELMSLFCSIFGGGETGIVGGKSGYSPSWSQLDSPARQSTEAVPITNKLDIKFDSTTNLVVDGRILASIVKPYLAADLMKTNESGGTVTRSYVI
jgi:hypothetical protein